MNKTTPTMTEPAGIFGNPRKQSSLLGRFTAWLLGNAGTAVLLLSPKAEEIACPAQDRLVSTLKSSMQKAKTDRLSYEGWTKPERPVSDIGWLPGDDGYEKKGS